MKITPVRNINNCSRFKSSAQTQTITQPTIKTDDENKNLALIGLSALGVAAIAICSARSHGVKNIQDLKVKTKQVTTNFNKKISAPKRGPEARRRYIFEENQRKLESLHKRFFNGEFDNKSPEVMEKIIRNEIKLANATGRLIKG